MTFFIDFGFIRVGMSACCFFSQVSVDIKRRSLNFFLFFRLDFFFVTSIRRGPMQIKESPWKTIHIFFTFWMTTTKNNNNHIFSTTTTAATTKNDHRRLGWLSSGRPASLLALFQFNWVDKLGHLEVFYRRKSGKISFKSSENPIKPHQTQSNQVMKPGETR